MFGDYWFLVARKGCVNMKKFIAALVVFVVIGAGWWLYQEQRTKDFKETALSIYKPYKVLVDDGNNLAKNMSGRNYDNLFRELGDIKQKNQDLKMKASSLIPPTDAAKAVHKQLIATLQAHDEGISGIIALIEANRYMTINDFDKIKANPNFTVIGHMTQESEGIHLITRAKTKIELRARGWNALEEE